MYMLYLFDFLWDKICGKREKVKEKEPEKYCYIDREMVYNTVICDDDDISDYGQFVELDEEYFYDGCRIRGCEWCASRYEMEGH